MTAELAGIEDLTVKNDWRPSKVLGTDGKEYGAFRSHTSASDGSDRPTTGASWQANWTETGAAGSAAPAWQPGTAYDGDYDSVRTLVRVTLTSSCWLKNVRIDRCGKRCIELFRDNYRFEIRDSHIVRCINRWDSDNCYGTLIGAYTSGALIENNILESLADGPMFAWSASGNVVAYNYIYDAHRTLNQRTWFTADGGSHHGAHTSFNLWEGNELESVYFDQYWGGHSHNTLFRNRILGKYMVDGIADESYFQNVNVIATEKDVRHQSYLGNVLGTAGYQTVYERNAQGCPSGFTDKKIYRTGYVSSGDCSVVDADPAVFATMLRHMNFDYVSNSIKLCSDASEPGCQGADGGQSLPPSLYRTTKPAWYGAGAWPAFDPTGPSVSDIPAKLRFLGVSQVNPPQRLRVVR